MLDEHARDDHNHNASNHSPNGSTATRRFADNDDNDTYGRWLLIDRGGRGCVCCRDGPWSVSALQKTALNPTGQRPVATVVTRSGFLSGRFCALGFLFLRLTDDGRDRLKFFAIAEIH